MGNDVRNRTLLFQDTMHRDNKHGNEACVGIRREGSTAIISGRKQSKAVKMPMLVALLEEMRLWVPKRIDAKISFELNSYRQFQTLAL
jgi:hypothetical protein